MSRHQDDLNERPAGPNRVSDEALLDRLDYLDTVRTLRERLASFKHDKRGRPLREVIEQIAADAGMHLNPRL